MIFAQRRCFLSAAILGLVFTGLAQAAPEDTTADAVLGQPDFSTNTANNGGASASSLTTPRGIFADATGRLWVCDNGNNRVLSWPDGSAFVNNAAADIVLGQANFTTVTANRGGANPAANTLAGPRSVCVDGSGRVYVADSDNKRILRYDPPITSGMNANQVFGQAGSFTTANQAAANAATANNMGNPDGVAVTAAGNTMAMADLFLKRVLIFNNPGPGGDTTADVAIGQPDFAGSNANQGGANPAANTLFNPEHVAFDAQGRLYVADQENHRIVQFVPPFTTNMNASKVWGQPGFTTGNAANPPTATSLNVPVGVCVDSLSGNLYVADSINMRILEFANPESTTTASRVFGQLGDFTTKVLNKGGLSANTLNDVGGVSCDAKGNLYAGDRNNNRALRFNVAPPVVVTPPTNANTGNQTTGTGSTPSSAAPCGLCGPGTATMMPLTLLGWFGIRRIRRKR